MEERIALSARERERLKILHEIGQGHLSQVEGSRRLELSTRQVRRLERRVEAEGAGKAARPHSGRGAAALPGLRSDAGGGEVSRARAGGEPGDPAEVDDRGRAVASTSEAAEGGAHVARAASLVWRAGDDGLVALLLVGRARSPVAVDCPDRRCHEPHRGPVRRARLDAREPEDARRVAPAPRPAPGLVHRSR